VTKVYREAQRLPSSFTWSGSRQKLSRHLLKIYLCTGWSVARLGYFDNSKTRAHDIALFPFCIPTFLLLWSLLRRCGCQTLRSSFSAPEGSLINLETLLLISHLLVLRSSASCCRRSCLLPSETQPFVPLQILLEFKFGISTPQHLSSLLLNLSSSFCAVFFRAVQTSVKIFCSFLASPCSSPAWLSLLSRPQQRSLRLSLGLSGASPTM
jgi:hypothetical protein